MTKKEGSITLTTTIGHYLCQGIQLRERTLVPQWLGDFVLWIFFHRLDTATTVTITRGFSGESK